MSDNRISTEEILDIAKLSRLAVSPKQADGYAQDLSKILAMMDLLAEVDTDGVAPLTNVHDMTQRLRDDIPNRDIDRELNQSNAPSVADGLFLVPQVIE